MTLDNSLTVTAVNDPMDAAAYWLSLLQRVPTTVYENAIYRMADHCVAGYEGAGHGLWSFARLDTEALCLYCGEQHPAVVVAYFNESSFNQIANPFSGQLVTLSPLLVGVVLNIYAVEWIWSALMKAGEDLAPMIRHKDALMHYAQALAAKENAEAALFALLD